MRTRTVCRSCRRPVDPTDPLIHEDPWHSDLCDVLRDGLPILAVIVRVCDVSTCNREADVLTRFGTGALCSGHARAGMTA